MVLFARPNVSASSKIPRKPAEAGSKVEAAQEAAPTQTSPGGVAADAPAQQQLTAPSGKTPRRPAAGMPSVLSPGRARPATKAGAAVAAAVAAGAKTARPRTAGVGASAAAAGTDAKVDAKPGAKSPPTAPKRSSLDRVAGTQQPQDTAKDQQAGKTPRRKSVDVVAKQVKEQKLKDGSMTSRGSADSKEQQQAMAAVAAMAAAVGKTPRPESEDARERRHSVASIADIAQMLLSQHHREGGGHRAPTEADYMKLQARYMHLHKSYGELKTAYQKTVHLLATLHEQYKVERASLLAQRTEMKAELKAAIKKKEKKLAALVTQKSGLEEQLGQSDERLRAADEKLRKEGEAKAELQAKLSALQDTLTVCKDNEAFLQVKLQKELEAENSERRMEVGELRFQAEILQEALFHLRQALQAAGDPDAGAFVTPDASGRWPADSMGEHGHTCWLYPPGPAELEAETYWDRLKTTPSADAEAAAAAAAAVTPPKPCSRRTSVDGGKGPGGLKLAGAKSGGSVAEGTRHEEQYKAAARRRSMDAPAPAAAVAAAH